MPFTTKRSFAMVKDGAFAHEAETAKSAAMPSSRPACDDVMVGDRDVRARYVAQRSRGRLHVVRARRCVKGNPINTAVPLLHHQHVPRHMCHQTKKRGVRAVRQKTKVRSLGSQIALCCVPSLRPSIARSLTFSPTPLSPPSNRASTSRTASRTWPC